MLDYTFISTDMERRAEPTVSEHLRSRERDGWKLQFYSAVPVVLPPRGDLPYSGSYSIKVIHNFVWDKGDSSVSFNYVGSG